MAHFSTPTSRWAALTSRNPLASDAFIYSVLSTKIYCRPTCPSRLARRANIVFHDSCTEAAAAGFRPCKRCRPEVEGGSPGDGQKVLVAKACGLIENEGVSGSAGLGVGVGVQLEMEVEVGKWSVRDLARECGVTESHFCRVFKKVMGCTVGEYRKQLQLKHAQETSPEDITIPLPLPATQTINPMIPKPDALVSEGLATTGSWELSLAQYPLDPDLDGNWLSSIEAGDSYDNQLLDLDFSDLDLEMSNYLLENMV
ncbi:Bifunctional transcriptional activator/DNA repair enzyme [Lachnellula hyalina]|uniref:Bifunctional transcriptional activator/DNA repair enzyme n=1 Tax=Lachnellula hyalina TaxID=1316788 RepID=A0A8H8R2C6_9HELO|nr:Bifunctional transcriptional activator/DNA repair enzyme [Lachnellula hyalina]TVY25609.1 Bifunctional transcriptional activator/DNA repair enzyme [Lachnellula hyalina]